MVESVDIFWILLSWDGGINMTTYYIIEISGAGVEVTAAVDGSETSKNVTELQQGTEYTLRVIAVATDGRISPPSVPLIVTTFVQGKDSLTVVLHTCWQLQ